MGRWGERVGRPCERCGAPMTLLPSDPRRFCSRDCVKVPLGCCLYCGGPKKQRKTTYCSPTCRGARKSKGLRVTKCETCGVSFVSKSQWRKEVRFCDSCKNRSQGRKRFTDKRSSVPWRTCGECRGRFIARAYTTRRCPHCRIKTESKPCDLCGTSIVTRCFGRRKKRCDGCIWRTARARRRARQRAAFVEDFDPIEIFERDGWVCQLCGDPVRRDVRWMHPLAPCVDHIRSFSNGGLHERKNAQCSHQRCNNRKGNRDEWHGS